MWLACHNQEEIAQAVDATQRKISDLSIGFSEIGNLSESAKSLALTPPLRANVRSLAHCALQSDVAACLKRANITALNIIQNAQLV
jgi:hypothetical protein